MYHYINTFGITITTYTTYTNRDCFICCYFLLYVSTSSQILLLPATCRYFLISVSTFWHIYTVVCFTALWNMMIYTCANKLTAILSCDYTYAYNYTLTIPQTNVRMYVYVLWGFKTSTIIPLRSSVNAVSSQS